MIPYWFFFLVPAIAALESRASWRLRRDGARSLRLEPSWLLVIACLTVIIGLRYDVGGDWSNYFRYYYQARTMLLEEAVLLDDPGYRVLAWASAQLGLGITGANVASAFFFAIGLTVFCRSLPRPSLALAVAMPYMVTVVAMGYTRQSVALGFAMLGLVALGRRSVLFFIFWVALGSVFHKSAVLLIPIAALTITTNRFMTGGIVIFAAGLAYRVLLEDHAGGLINTYVDENIASSGAFIRLAMNVVPAVVFLFLRKRFIISEADFNLWRLLALISIAAFVANLLLPLSTALDRLALYLIPLQLFVFSNLPDVLGRVGGRNQQFIVGVLLFYTIVLFVWLFFATHARYWLPYQISFSIAP